MLISCQVFTFKVFLGWFLLKQSASLPEWRVNCRCNFFELNRLSMNEFILLLNITWIFNVILYQVPFLSYSALSTRSWLTVAASTIAAFMNCPTLHLITELLTTCSISYFFFGFCSLESHQIKMLCNIAEVLFCILNKKHALRLKPEVWHILYTRMFE